jgi:hypothetical protein
MIGEHVGHLRHAADEQSPPVRLAPGVGTLLAPRTLKSGVRMLGRVPGLGAPAPAHTPENGLFTTRNATSTGRDDDRDLTRGVHRAEFELHPDP